MTNPAYNLPSNLESFALSQWKMVKVFLMHILNYARLSYFKKTAQYYIYFHNQR